MYEKTVGGFDYIYSITLSATPKTLWELLSPSDQTELQSMLGVGTSKKRVVIDGWIYSASSFSTLHKVGGAEEIIDGGAKYPMPIYQWHEKKLFKGTEGQAATVRIIMSAHKADQ